MEEFTVWLQRRARENGTALSETYTLSNSTKALINSLAFAESKSVRTSAIILASFNIIVAASTAFSILYDGYFSSKRCSPDGKAHKFCISKIHPAETVPLVLALTIVVQSLVFAGVQSTGLQSLNTNGCSSLAQVLFPALFLTPYVLIVFGVECSIRSLSKVPFRARGKYDVVICLGIVGLMTFATWIPTHVHPQTDHCFASLMWFVTDFGVLGLALLSITIGLTLTTAGIICYRLSTVSSIPKEQRIAASRMVYYLILGVIFLSFVIPWFVSLTVNDPKLVLSMMATVVVNLSGIMLCAIQLFLRSNTMSTAFGPRGNTEWSKAQHHIRIWGPNELGFDRHVLQPVSGPRSESRNSLVPMEKRGSLEMESMQSPQYTMSPTRPRTAAEPPLPTIPEPTAFTPSATTTSPRRHQRKPSYSLFPAGNEITSPVKAQAPTSTAPTFTLNTAQPVRANDGESMLGQAFSLDDIKSIYISNDLEPPPSLAKIIGSGSRHRRDSSMVSSATVQIGLRMSHAPEDDGSGARQSNINYLSQGPTSPLPRLQTQNLTLQPPPLVVRPNGPAPLQRKDSKGRDARMKTLPPVPRGTVFGFEEASSPETIIQLSPTVYSPDTPKKTGEPSSAAKQASPAQVQLAPSQRLQVGNDDVQDPRTRVSKADWI